MKSVAVVALCLVAAVAADPGYGHGYYGHGYGLGYYGHGYGHGYYGHYLGKRSADAEPTAVADAEPTAVADADPSYGHAVSYAHHGYHPPATTTDMLPTLLPTTAMATAMPTTATTRGLLMLDMAMATMVMPTMAMLPTPMATMDTATDTIINLL